MPEHNQEQDSWYTESSLLEDIGEIRIGGVLTDDLVNSLIHEIETLRRRYLYQQILIKIQSPGGSVPSLDFLINKMDTSFRDIKIETEAMASVASGAAILLSLGETAKASAESSLHYHKSRTFDHGNGALTASSHRTIADGLEKTDKNLLKILVNRACLRKIDLWKKYIDQNWVLISKSIESPHFHLKESRLCSQLFGISRTISTLTIESLIYMEHDYANTQCVFKHWEILNFAIKKLESKLAITSPQNRNYKNITQVTKFLKGMIDNAIRKEAAKQINASEVSTEVVEGNSYDTDVSRIDRDCMTFPIIEELRFTDFVMCLLDTEGSRFREIIELVIERLLEMDRPIPPAVAKALGLIDEIGVDKYPLRARKRGLRLMDALGPNEEVIVGDLPIDEWKDSLKGGLSYEQLCRHVFIMGETGSGKTKSAVMPLLASIMKKCQSNIEPRVSCLVVVDPKKELWQQFANIESESVEIKNIHTRERLDFRLNLMAFEPIYNVHIGITNREQEHFIELADAILKRTATLVPTSPQGAVYGFRPSAKDPHWDEVGTKFARSFLIATLILYDLFYHLTAGHIDQDNDKEGSSHVINFTELSATVKDKLERFKNHLSDSNADINWEGIYTPEASDDKKARVETVFSEILDMLWDNYASGKNILRSATNFMDKATLYREEIGGELYPHIVGNIFKIVSLSNEYLSDSYTKKYDIASMLTSQVHASQDQINSYAGQAQASGINNEYSSVKSVGKRCFSAFEDKESRNSVLFGVESSIQFPNDFTKFGDLIDFQNVVKPIDSSQKTIVYLVTPELNDKGNLVTRALKEQFFKAVLSDEKREDPSRSLEEKGLVGYVADEFQRFITQDRYSGEQSYLDTCRSFGGFCILATQAVSSLKHNLLEGSDSASVVAALEVLVGNTGTKIAFRSSTFENSQLVSHWIGDEVLKWRPLASLKPGECYMIVPDGNRYRTQFSAYKISARN